MLQDRILNSVEFLRLLAISRGTFDMRTARGEVALALGRRRASEHNRYLALDAVAMLLTEKLGTEIGMKSAAEVVIQGSEPWLRAVMAAEIDPRLYTETPIPPEQHLFLSLGVEKGRLPKAVVGLMADCTRQLSGYGIIRGISIQLCLRELRNASLQCEIPLPSRLTPPLDDPAIGRWWQEVNDYRRVANRRFEARQSKKGAHAREIA